LEPLRKAQLTKASQDRKARRAKSGAVSAQERALPRFEARSQNGWLVGKDDFGKLVKSGHRMFSKTERRNALRQDCQPEKLVGKSFSGILVGGARISLWRQAL